MSPKTFIPFLPQLHISFLQLFRRLLDCIGYFLLIVWICQPIFSLCLKVVNRGLRGRGASSNDEDDGKAHDEFQHYLLPVSVDCVNVGMVPLML